MYSPADPISMKAITIRLEESTIESIDEEAS